MLKEAHAIGNKTQKPFQQALGWGRFNPLAGILFRPGEFKNRRNQLSVERGISDSQNKVLKRKLRRLEELGVYKHVTNENRVHYSLLPSILNPPKYENGQWKGWYLYPSARIVEQAVQDICDWANLQMQRIWNEEEGAYDPIYVAVVVKQALIYIHPFVDGNGRFGVAVRDKILENFGFSAGFLFVPSR